MATFWSPITSVSSTDIMVTADPVLTGRDISAGGDLLQVVGTTETLLAFTSAGSVVLSVAGVAVWTSEPGIIVSTADGGGNTIPGTPRKVAFWWSATESEVRAAVYPAGGSEPLDDSGLLPMESDAATAVSRNGEYIYSSVVTVGSENAFPEPPPVFRMFPFGPEVTFKRADAVLCTVQGTGWDPGGSYEPRTDPGSERVISTPTAYVPYAVGALVTALDTCIIDGVTYEAEGNARAFLNPLTGTEAGAVISLQRVQG